MKEKEKAWTLFWDMHSGGGSKEDWSKIYIEAPEEEAAKVFYNRFGHSPYRVSCTCCGEDYSVHEYHSFEKASAYSRNCRWDKEKKGYVEEPQTGRNYQTVDEYKKNERKNERILVIKKEDIKTEERKGTVPEEGYVWM